MRVSLLTLIIVLIVLPAYAKYSSGTGEPNDPYQIATADDLMLLGDSPEDYDKHFILTDDIDLDPNLPGRKVFDKAVIGTFGIVGRAGGSPGTPFRGIFDGNGRTISNLTITGTENLGLFGWLTPGSEVKDLGVVSVNITSSSGTIGGLVAFNDGCVTNSYSTGSITGSTNVGGLVGTNYGSIATSCSIATISGDSYVGGLVGVNYESNITKSYSSGVVSGTAVDVGGLVGQNGGRITECHSSSEVSGSFSVGGLVGENDGGDVTDCYSTGTAGGTESVGGLVGSNVWQPFYYGKPEREPRTLVTKCYSTGSVSGDSRIGGLVGDGLNELVATCFWDVQTSGQTSSSGGFGLTTAEMMDPYMFGLNGFGDDPNWILDSGRDYPRLAWEGTPGQIIPEPRVDWLEGDGTEQDPYRVDTAEQLIFWGQASFLCDRHFILGADINLDPNLPGRQIFPQAVIPTFTGVFDGCGHTISHLTITGGKYLGLFGKLSGQIKNLGVVDATIVGSDDYVGGLVGYNLTDGIVINCYSTGTISGASRVGGLVGKNNGSTATSDSTGMVNGSKWSVGGLVGENCGITCACYSAAIVTGGSRCVGGLVGENLGTISNCYSTGSVYGENYVGGLVGTTGVRSGDLQAPVPGTIVNCYSTGLVSGNSDVGGLVGLHALGTTTGSFWDIQTSGLTISDGGTGLTTAEMHNIDTYLNTGWDFVDEILNGTCDSWQISLGDFPHLHYHAGNGPAMPDGLGTIEEPYLIRDARDLGAVWYEPAAHYRLQATVDLSGITWSMAVVPWFCGTFEGNGHMISNLHIHGGGRLGLFGQLDSGANISNLGIEAVDVNGTGYYVGGLTGDNHGTVTECYTAGSVSGKGDVGRLAGRSSSTIAMSYSTGTVSGDSHVGGLVGSSNGSITASHSTGTVSGRWRVGGLVGSNDGSITVSHSTGTVSGSSSAGGLVGDNGGSITASYSTGTVSGDNSVGGLVGYTWQGSIATSYSTATIIGANRVGGLVGYNGGAFAKITTSYSTGAVSGNERVGGLVGYNYGSTVSKSYSTGTVSGDSNVGGLVGEDYKGNGSIISSFWDTWASGQRSSAGGTGKTTAEMQVSHTFLDAGWDLMEETANGTDDIWWILEGQDYPRLWWEPLDDSIN